jgi:hypothetical protein
MFKKAKCQYIVLMTTVEEKVEEAMKQYGGPQDVFAGIELIQDFLEVKSKGEDFARRDFYNKGQIDEKYYEVISKKHRRIAKYLDTLPDKAHLRITIIYKEDNCILATLAKRGEQMFINIVNKEHVSAMYLGNDYEKAKGEYEFLVRSIHSILGD